MMESEVIAVDKSRPIVHLLVHPKVTRQLTASLVQIEIAINK